MFCRSDIFWRSYPESSRKMIEQLIRCSERLVRHQERLVILSVCEPMGGEYMGKDVKPGG